MSIAVRVLIHTKYVLCLEMDIFDTSDNWVFVSKIPVMVQTHTRNLQTSMSYFVWYLPPPTKKDEITSN